jgi:putative membrane-bound dehydrogenase-like protein
MTIIKTTTSWISIYSILFFLPLFSINSAYSFESPVENHKGVEKHKGVGPFSPKESLKHFQLHPSLQIELVAAEPQVVDPVAIRFDSNGRLWVVEMGDYPNGPKEGEKPVSRIRVLDDLDGDGYYEKSTIFADHLMFATGIQPWRDGLIVTYGGTVAFFRDINGDDRVDEKEIWFTGFEEKNPQLRANHPTLGLNNQIYISNGLRGGKVIARRDKWKENAKPVSISGMDFRFNVLTGEYEAISGLGQFGLTFDNYGNRFICTNRNPCRHIVLDNNYIKRNPHILIKETMYDVSPAGVQSRIYPISKFWTTSNLHAGQFTACCGVTIYRGNTLPKEFQNNSFTCDPTGNLVHRDIHFEKGATFGSKYGREKTEFLATKDEWCRMVNLNNGPDGNLYVVDMYRAVIEHPQFVPIELKNRPDSYYGNDRGRIYRIVPKSKLKKKQIDNLSSLSLNELGKLLGHSNSWQRETAARLIYEKQDKSCIPEILNVVRNSNNPAGQVQGLWAINGIGGTNPEILIEVFNNPKTNDKVREQILLLSEPLLNSNPSLQEIATRVVKNSSARYQFQQALTLGTIAENPAILKPLNSIALKNGHLPWIQNAISISLSQQPVPFLKQFANRLSDTSAGVKQLELLFEVSRLIGSRTKQKEIEDSLSILTQISNPGIKTSILSGLSEGYAGRGKSISKIISGHPDSEMVLKQTDKIFENSIFIAADKNNPIAERIKNIRLIRFSPKENSVNAVVKLATNDTVISVQQTSLSTLTSFRNLIQESQADELLDKFPSQPPAVRRAILDLFLSHVSLTSKLLDSIEEEEIASTELDINRIKKIMAIKNPVIQKRVKTLLKDAMPKDRSKVLKDYQSVLTVEGNAKRGKELFKKTCTTCHKIGDIGVDVGPDISDSRVKTPAQLLTSILDPNQAIDNNYFSYSVVKTSGQIVTGIIVSETSSSITIRQPEGKMVSLLRQDIDELRSNGVSLMPVGLEKDLSKDQMADLISFIKNWRYMDGSIPFAK